MSIRAWVTCIAAVFASAFAALPVHAEDFPSRPVRIIVPYAAGGVVDALARVLAGSMKDTLGQPVIVENRPGASGVVGMQGCAQAAPDGHTLCITVQDSVYMYPHRDEKITSCADAVRKVVTIAQELGREIATPAEARQLMGLTQPRARVRTAAAAA